MAELISLTNAYREKLFQFELTNRAWFELWVPPRPEYYYQEVAFQGVFDDLLSANEQGADRFYLLVEQGEIIGRFNLTDINRRAEIGYRVAKDKVGKGYATLGLQELIVEAQKLGLAFLHAKALKENPASTRMLLKQRFLPTSDIEVVLLNGTQMHLQSYQRELP